jgi:hypothetical protein
MASKRSILGTGSRRLPGLGTCRTAESEKPVTGVRPQGSERGGRGGRRFEPQPPARWNAAVTNATLVFGNRFRAAEPPVAPTPPLCLDEPPLKTEVYTSACPAAQLDLLSGSSDVCLSVASEHADCWAARHSLQKEEHDGRQAPPQEDLPSAAPYGLWGGKTPSVSGGVDALS